jgi:hypothetical protein
MEMRSRRVQPKSLRAWDENQTVGNYACNVTDHINEIPTSALTPILNAQAAAAHRRATKLGWRIRYDPVKSCYVCIDFKTGNKGFGRSPAQACWALTGAVWQMKEVRLALLKAIAGKADA